MPRPPDLLLVLVDDLRADRIGCAGLARAETPTLDRLAREGLRCERAFAACGWTLPSCASIVTGLLPSQHGLRHHDCRFEAPKIPARLGPGWATFGVGNNGNLVPDTISRESLDAAGFERRPEVWKHFGWQEGFETYEWFPKSDADGPFAAFARWHAGRAADGRPWFAMLHTNVVHDYDGDRPWCVDVERFLGRPLHPALRKFRDGPWIWQTPPEGVSPAQLAEEMLAKYDGCIAEFDRRLAAVLAAVDLSRTVVCVVSDHGEGFDGPAGRVHHCGRLHDDLLRVPLIVRFPQGAPGAPAAGTVVEEPCSTLDVATTLLAAGGGDLSGLPGIDLRAPKADRVLAAEDFGYLYLPPTDVEAPFHRLEYKHHDLHSRAEVRWPRKEIRVRLGRQSWGADHDLAGDPLERVNLFPGAQGPTRAPRRREGALAAWWAERTSKSSEAETQRKMRRYRRLVRWGAGRRKLPRIEAHRPFASIPNAEPITFVVAVNDPAEFRLHALASDCFRNGRHQWLVVENTGNRAYDSISRLYFDAGRRARHDLRFYVHQDVVFPPDFEERVFRAIAELDRLDPRWGVIGAVGRAVTPPDLPPGELPGLVGHWSDPHGRRPGRTRTPAEVQVLDEMWLGFRASRGIDFDPDLPGFHCYGADICLAARAAGMRSWAVDAPVVHKLWRPDGTLIEHKEQSGKIAARKTDAFRADFLRTADYVGTKWARFRPFYSTSHRWPAEQGDGKARDLGQET